MPEPAFTLPLAPITLRGEREDDVRLVPMADEHIDGLFAASSPETFRYFLSWPRQWSLPCFAEWLGAMRTSPRNHVFAVVLGGSGRIAGSTSYLDADAPNRSLEIGATWYAPDQRGTGINAACKALLLRHAFESLGCVRVTLKCDERNAHSRRAIAGIGATFEGILRNHRIMQDGYVRNTAMFGITREDWPRIAERLCVRGTPPADDPAAA